MRCRVVLVLLAAAGCGGSNTGVRTTAPTVTAARFRTTAKDEDVRANACALVGAFNVGSRPRHWVVSVDDLQCWSPPDASAIPLYVHIDTAKGERAVVLAATPPADVPVETLRDAVASTGVSLKQALEQVGKLRTAQATSSNQGGGHGGAIAAAAVGGGVAVAVVVVLVVVLVGALVAAFSALAAALGKAF